MTESLAPSTESLSSASVRAANPRHKIAHRFAKLAIAVIVFACLYFAIGNDLR